MEQLGIASNAPKPKSRLRELLWPEITDIVAAQTAVNNGMYASFFIAGVTTLASLFNLLPRAALVDAALFAAIGIGIRRFSRVASVAGLVLYVIEQVYSISQGRVVVNVVMLAILTAIFASAVRAAWFAAGARRTVTPAAAGSD